MDYKVCLALQVFLFYKEYKIRVPVVVVVAGLEHLERIELGTGCPPKDLNKRSNKVFLNVL